MKFLISLLIIQILSIGCKSRQPQDEILNWQAYKNITDSYLHTVSTKDINIFAELESETYKQVFDITSLEERYVSIIKVIISPKMKFFIEEPYSESGDWNNEYIYVFDVRGKLQLFIRTSSFFNSGCSDKIVTEKEIFANEAGLLIKKEYEIFDENKIAITDTTNCIFNYRFKYPVYLNYYEIPVIKKYKNDLSK